MRPRKPSINHIEPRMDQINHLKDPEIFEPIHQPHKKKYPNLTSFKEELIANNQPVDYFDGAFLVSGNTQYHMYQGEIGSRKAKPLEEYGKL